MNATIKIDTDVVQKLIDDFNFKMKRKSDEVFLSFVLETETPCEELKDEVVLRIGNMEFLYAIKVKKGSLQIHRYLITDKFEIFGDGIDNPLFNYILDLRYLIYNIHSYVYITPMKENEL